ncbi:MAG: ABC transporter substrate-binding protein [Peptococcaceae bacterium]|jgi:branched-chain amino acid transport system substrate-binding protein|nr:ABC transporter substrate-binding protein [Peptococcaceae bacterium]MDH7523963.1 ABC transporter substrate-binding protein [Peptococcaceae bacterium]
MRLNKKIVLVILVAFVLTIAAGCSGTPKKEAPAPEKPKEIVIGANFELSGNVATFGQSIMNAMEMAIAEINASGGVLGANLKMVKADNKSDAAESTNCATKLITQDKVVALLGPVTSTNVLAASPVAEQYKIPLLTPTGTASKLTVDDSGKTKPYIFRNCFIDPFQGLVGANFALNTLKAKTAAIFIEKNSDYAKGLCEVFEKTFTEKGGKIVAKEAFVTEDKDFRAPLTKIKSTNPDVLYVPSYYEQDGLIAKQARELGYTNPIVGADGWDSSKLLEIAGAKALQKVYFTNHYSAFSTDPKVVKFVNDYKAKYGSVPDALAALGYDATYLMADAIKRAGAPDPAKIRDALENTKGFQGVTGTITMDDKHNPVKSAVILSFDKDGNQIFVESVNP